MSVFIGIVIQEFSSHMLYDTEAVNALRVFLLVTLLVFALTVKFTKNLLVFYFLTIALFAFGGADFINDIKDLPISSTKVINTDLIVNIFLIVLAFAISIFFAFSVTKFINYFTNKKLFISVVIFSFVLFMMDLLAKIMLFLLRQDLIETTSARLSFVAKVTHYEYIFIYIYILILILFVALFYNRFKNEKIDQSISSPMRRKSEKKLLVKKRWVKTVVPMLFVLGSYLLYYDLYASRPIQISEAKILTPNTEDNFVIDLKDVSDGDLHRYAYIAGDGRKIRFFVINRYPDQEKVVPVFDACMICGDMGYIKKDNQVICIACDVRIFVPSIGKPGGCNPIPFKYTKKDGKLIIPKKEIVAGATYFSQTVEVDVTDIISGVKLINTQAKYFYEYKGKTFYFESEQNLEIFRDDPQNYAKDIVDRKWRTQGYKDNE